MSNDTNQDAEQSNTTPSNNKKFAVHTLYIKDVSFEAPNTPGIFQKDWDPQISVELNTQAQLLAKSDFEVLLSLTITAKLDDNVAYLVEVHQSGVFGLDGYSEKQLPALLGVHCPQLLYPYACEAASSLVRKGGFPQLNLSPVNFELLYRSKSQDKQPD